MCKWEICLKSFIFKFANFQIFKLFKMAKKGNRVQVILECTEQKNTNVPGTSRYISEKNKKNNPERWN
jgi:ribosomal protein L33